MKALIIIKVLQIFVFIYLYHDSLESKGNTKGILLAVIMKISRNVQAFLHVKGKQ